MRADPNLANNGQQAMIADFMRVLRASDIRVSPAEAIDVAAVIDMMGLGERALLKHALGHAVAKTEDEKLAFDAAFEAYFMPPQTAEPDAANLPTNAENDERQAEAEADDGESDDGDGANNEGMPGEGGEGGEPSGQGGQPAQGGAQMPDREIDTSQTLTEMVERNNQPALQAAMTAAATQAGLQNARLFTQQGMFSRRILEAMGLAGLDEDLRNYREAGMEGEATRLQQGRARLFDQVHDFVERQIAMRTKNAGRLLREEALSRIRLGHLDKSDMALMRNLIRRLAKRLASRHARRRKKARRGMLDIRRTMRRNQAYDGNLFELAWRRTKIDRPKLIVLCDVSGSVAAVSRFFLMFLYSLGEVMPKTRSFIFSNRAGEITDLMAEKDIDEAMQEALRNYGGGSTDYGVALHDLAEAVLDKVDKKTTLIVLGDGRSNFGDPGHLVLKEIHERARRVIWLNPEPESSWNTGDSEMKRLGAYCTQVNVCNSVRHVERVLDDLLRLSV
ncbi:MAG: VWA domain-containing protein [Parvibaculales bacterium]